MAPTPEQGTIHSGVIVVELDDVVQRRHPDLPNVFVTSTRSPIEQRFEELQREKGPDWIKGHIVALRPDLSVKTAPVSPAEARSRGKHTIASLKSQGYTVNLDTYIWSVYVIELDPTAAKDPGRGVVYVGETCRTPEERFEQHITRAHGSTNQRLYSSVVAKYGKCLRMDLAPSEPLFDKESARRTESEWAEHLRSLGYVVKGGH